MAGGELNIAEETGVNTTGYDNLGSEVPYDPEAAMRARQEVQEQEKGVEIANELSKGQTTAAVFIEGGQNMTFGELKAIKNKPNAYTAERQKWHDEVIREAMIASEKLSDELGPPPRIIAMRGGCGSGKTTAVKNRYGNKNIFDNNGDVPGAVKPDYFKGVIQQEAREKRGVEITSDQTHMESTGICKMFTEELVKTDGVSMLIDKQLEAADDIADIIKWGKESGKSVELLDNDVPIELSAFRVLKRTLAGADPNITFDSVAKGFRGIRANRRQEINDIENNSDVVSSFSLRAFDPVSKQQIEIATRSENGTITPIAGYEDLYRAVSSQSKREIDQEVENAGKQIINEEYIESFVSKYFDEANGPTKWSQEARDVLNAYSGLGMTLQEAMESKAVAGINTDRNENNEFNDPNYRAKLVQWLQQKRSNNMSQEKVA